MTTVDEHIQRAEELLVMAESDDANEKGIRYQQGVIALAQVHATLAVAKKDHASV